MIAKILLTFIYLLVQLSVTISQNKKELEQQIVDLNVELDRYVQAVEVFKRRVDVLTKDSLRTNEQLLELRKEIQSNVIAKDAWTKEVAILNENYTKLQKDFELCFKAPENMLYQAQLVYGKGELENAMDQYEELLKLYPASPEAEVAKQRCESIRKEIALKNAEDIKKKAGENLRITKDEFKMRTFYEDERGDQYHFDLEDILAPDLKLNLYFSIPFGSNKPESLRFIVGYSDDDWLFVDKVTFLIDGRQHHIYGEFERDSGYGDVYEWLDQEVNTSMMQIINAIMDGDMIKVRFSGDQYYADTKVSKEQQEAILSMYRLYKEKGGIH